MASLGQTLLQHKLINLIQLNLALDFKVFYGGRLGTNLLELGIISEETLGRALGESLGLPVAYAPDFQNIPADVIQELSAEVAFRTQALPFRRVGDTLDVVVIDTRNEAAMKELRKSTKRQLRIHVAPELRIQTALQEYYRIRMDPRLQAIAQKTLLRTTTNPAFSREIPAAPASAKPPVTAWMMDDGVAFAPPSMPAPMPLRSSASSKVTLSIQKLALALDEATSRDEIASLILNFSQKYLQRVALFILRREVAFGWDGAGGELTRDRVKSIIIPLGEPSIFQIVVESQGHFLGAVPDSDVNQHFLRALGDPAPANALLLPLTIAGITFAVLYGDNGAAQVESSGINELQVMVSRANIAFERLIISERQKALKQHDNANR